MALKAKKRRPTKTSTRPWSDLPQQLVKLIARPSTLIPYISFGAVIGVAKSWRAAPRQCNPVRKSPWLELSDTNYGNCSAPCRCRTHPRISNLSFFLSSGFAHSHLPGYVKGAGRIIPPWDTNVPIKYEIPALNTYTADPNRYISMVLTGTSRPDFVFHRIGRCQNSWISLQEQESAWIKQDCTLIDPHASDQQRMQFTNAVGFEGKLYALSLQGTLAVIEEIDFHPRITALSTSRAVPYVSSRHFREYSVESNRDIVLLFLISRKTINIVDDVEVFRLDILGLSWVKTESLGDRTFFVGADCCMLVTASKVGCRRNCIYFTHHTVDGWWCLTWKAAVSHPVGAVLIL